jgi:hypothetical protein
MDSCREVDSHGSQLLTMQEWRLNLLKDGGRCALYGGDPYEDDLERALVGPEETSRQPARQ